MIVNIKRLATFKECVTVIESYTKALEKHKPSMMTAKHILVSPETFLLVALTPCWEKVDDPSEPANFKGKLFGVPLYQDDTIEGLLWEEICMEEEWE